MHSTQCLKAASSKRETLSEHVKVLSGHQANALASSFQKARRRFPKPKCGKTPSRNKVEHTIRTCQTDLVDAMFPRQFPSCHYVLQKLSQTETRERTAMSSRQSDSQFGGSMPQEVLFLLTAWLTVQHHHAHNTEPPLCIFGPMATTFRMPRDSISAAAVTT